MKIVVLGGYGEMGRVIVTDLANTFRGEVLVAGRNKQTAVNFARSFHKKNVTGDYANTDDSKQIATLLKGTDVLINATNYYSNITIMKHALRNGVNYIDLGGLFHMTKKQLKMHGAFKKKGLIAVLGCGSTPGITNVLAEYGAKKFDKIDSLDVAFADKDYTKYNQPFVVPYSMQTVFDEFSKHPAILQKGKIRFVEPLSETILVDFPKPVGKVYCRSVLHSELASLPQSLHDKGIKECSFRGGWDEDFISKTKFLIQAGFSSDVPIPVGKAMVSPRATAVILLNKFMPPKGIKINDLEFLRVAIVGKKNGKKKTLVVYCRAVTERKFNIPAGSWDTGVPPSIVAQEIIKGQIEAKGVLTPERCIHPKLFFKALAKRNMKVFTRNR